MAVTFMTGFEGQAAAIDGITLSAATYGTGGGSGPRTGASAVRCFPGVGAAQYLTIATTGNYTHFGLYINFGPVSSGNRVVFGQIAAGTINIRMDNAGTLAVYLNTSLIGTSAALSVSVWHWIGVRQVTGTSVAFLQIDGADSVTGTATVSAISGVIGFSGTESSIGTCYIDDVIVDSAGFLAPSKVDIALPTADSARTAGWVG